MPDDNNIEIAGKKIFFLHPSAVVKNEIIPELVQLEYEIYVVKDENALLRGLSRYPQSVLFCGVDEALDLKSWEITIRRITGNPANKGIAIGAVVNNEDGAAKQLCTDTLKLSCGYVPVKHDVNRALKVLVDILRAVEAKGRRKYLRADTRDDLQATVNLSLDGRYINGSIRDISVVGFSCIFPDDPGLQKNALVSDIQLKLQSALLKVEGIVFGSRADEDGMVYVVVFTQKIDPVVRTKIRIYMQKNLQTKMEQELK
jgi:hypothetical protein